MTDLWPRLRSPNACCDSVYITSSSAVPMAPYKITRRAKDLQGSLLQSSISTDISPFKVFPVLGEFPEEPTRGLWILWEADTGIRSRSRFFLDFPSSSNYLQLMISAGQDAPEPSNCKTSRANAWEGSKPARVQVKQPLQIVVAMPSAQI